MAADLAHAHAARIHRDNLVVKVGESPLILRDQLRIIESEHPYIFLDGLVLKGSWAGRGPQRAAVGSGRGK